MVRKNVDIYLNAKGNAQAGFTKLNRGIDKSTDKMRGLRNAIVGAFGAVAAGAVARKSLQAFIEQEKSEQRLTNALRIRGLEIEKNNALLTEAAQVLQATTSLGDESALAIESMAIAMGSSVKNAIKLTAAASDLAAVLGKDVNETARQLIKTLGGFAGELGEVIPEMKALTKEQLQAGAAIDLIGDKFGGSAQDQANTFGGRMAQLSNLTGDLSEDLGRSLAPAVSLVNAVLVDNLPTMRTWVGLLGEGIVSVVSLAESIGSKLVPAYAEFTRSFGQGLVDFGVLFDAIKSRSTIDEFLANLKSASQHGVGVLAEAAPAKTRTLAEIIADALDGMKAAMAAAGVAGAAAGGRSSRTTASLSQSRFLTGVAGGKNVVDLQAETAKNSKLLLNEFRENKELIRELIRQGRVTVPFTTGVF